MSEIKNKSSDQIGAEDEVERFREDLGPFVVAAETTRMAMVFTNARERGNPIIFANDSFLALSGYERDELLGQGFNFLIALEATPEALAKVQSEFEDASENDPEICVRRKDGSMVWTTLFINPVLDQSGTVLQHFVSFVDQTKHKMEQARFVMLIDELNHRVKNTLSTVQSIVSQALRNSDDPATLKDAIESRIFALSRSHDLLTHSNWEGAGLHDLLGAALEPFGVANGRAERFKIVGKNIRMPPKATLALGVAFHELATNAVKYGAFSNEVGSILIAWTIEPTLKGDRLILRWSENGGPPVTPPSRKGFGSQVIERGLAHELEGEVHLDYRPAGVACTIDIPTPPGS